MEPQINSSTTITPSSPDYRQLKSDIQRWGYELGFQQVGITGIDLGDDEAYLLSWLDQGMHGEMEYMQRHGTRRSRPADLLPGTLRVISVRMDYWPKATDAESLLGKPTQAYISRYALGRDYHKVLRKRLQQLANRIAEATGPFGYRAFVDSAPVLEKAIARNASLGWIGKHTNLINSKAGSWFFLGELYTELPLPVDEPASNHCGSCTKCLSACPTDAIVAPYKVDARRCISYLTIELKGPIPIEFRQAMGNRVYGCDDCQLVCPWNKFAQFSEEDDFSPRHRLDSASMLELFQWTEQQFLERTTGSPIRRIGYERWQRNLAIGLGNGPSSPEVIKALRERLVVASELVSEHIQWALAQLVGKGA